MPALPLRACRQMGVRGAHPGDRGQTQEWWQQRPGALEKLQADQKDGARERQRDATTGRQESARGWQEGRTKLSFDLNSLSALCSLH